MSRPTSSSVLITITTGGFMKKLLLAVLVTVSPIAYCFNPNCNEDYDYPSEYDPGNSREHYNEED